MRDAEALTAGVDKGPVHVGGRGECYRVHQHIQLAVLTLQPFKERLDLGID